MTFESSTPRGLRWLAPFLAFSGLLLVFITPPIQVADEDSHFVRAVMVSRLDLALYTEGEVTGQMVPESLVAFVESHRSLATTSSERYTYDRWYQDSHAPAPEEPMQLHRYTGQSLSPLYYLPQVVGIWAGKALYAVIPGTGYNWPAQLYSARIGNLLFYVFAFAWAIAAAPRFGFVLAFVAVTPMALSLGASASYDVAVILGAVLFFAAIMRATEREGGPLPLDLLLIAGLAFFLGHNKAVYSPLLVLTLALWSAMGLRNWAVFAFVCGALALAGAAFSSLLFGLPANPALQSAVHAQSVYVRENPGLMPGLVVDSLMQARAHLFASSLGSLGWLNANLPFPLLAAWAGVGLAAIAADASKGRAPKAFVLAGLQTAAVVIAAFILFIAMYVTWTSLTTGIGAPVIDSVQGRYLLPLFAPTMGTAVALLSVAPWRRPVDFDAALKVCAGVVAGLMVFMLTVRYWV